MKTTVDREDGLSRKLNIEVPAEKVQDAFERVYKGIQKNANLKGFRKGKAPMEQIRRLYADRVKQDVLEDIVSRFFSQALSELDLNPVAQPKLDLGELEENSSFQFSAEFEIRPQIEVKTYENLSVEKEKLEIEEGRIDQVLENLRKDRAETVPVFEDRAAQDGDVAKIDFEGFIDGQPLQGGQANDHSLELGSQSFIPGFEEQVVGMKISEEKNIELSFPEDYHQSEIAGKPVLFRVKLNAIEKAVLPELNDDFAAKLGDYKTLEDLKTAIKDEITKGELDRIEQDLKNRIIRSLVEANPVEVPKALKDQQKQKLVQDLHQRMHQQGMSHGQFEEYKEKWDKDFEETAATMVKSAFLIDHLAEVLKLNASQKEIEDRITQNATSMGLDRERLAEFYNQPEKRSQLAYSITEEKVTQVLIDKANIKEVAKDQIQSA